MRELLIEKLKVVLQELINVLDKNEVCRNEKNFILGELAIILEMLKEEE